MTRSHFDTIVVSKQVIAEQGKKLKELSETYDANEAILEQQYKRITALRVDILTAQLVESGLRIGGLVFRGVVGVLLAVGFLALVIPSRLYL